MTKVSMIATSTFHATSVRAEPLHDGDQFEVTEAEARELEDRRLARRSDAAAEAKPVRRRATGKRGQ